MTENYTDNFYIHFLPKLIMSIFTFTQQGCRLSVFFRYVWPDPFSIFSYFIFLFLNFLSLFVFIFCETARTRRFSVIFRKSPVASLTLAVLILCAGWLECVCVCVCVCARAVKFVGEMAGGGGGGGAAVRRCECFMQWVQSFECARVHGERVYIVHVRRFTWEAKQAWLWFETPLALCFSPMNYTPMNTVYKSLYISSCIL